MIKEAEDVAVVAVAVVAVGVLVVVVAVGVAEARNAFLGVLQIAVGLGLPSQGVQSLPKSSEQSFPG